jgi:hypothetical protein
MRRADSADAAGAFFVAGCRWGGCQLQTALAESPRAIRDASENPMDQRIEQLVINVLRRDPATGRILAVTSRQHADARKRIRRACPSLVATGKLVKFGITWALPPETPAEAKIRRKRLHISERLEQQQEQERRSSSSAWLDRLLDRPPIDPTTRRRLVKVGELGGKVGGNSGQSE